MRGKKRTTEEKYELFSVLEYHLSLGFSLKKACRLADIPYSSMRDLVNTYEPLRARISALQNRVNTKAREVVAASVEKGNVNDAKWWLQHFDNLEAQICPVYGGEKEMELTYLEHKVQMDSDEPSADYMRSWSELLTMIKERDEHNASTA